MKKLSKKNIKNLNSICHCETAQTKNNPANCFCAQSNETQKAKRQCGRIDVGIGATKQSNEIATPCGLAMTGEYGRSSPTCHPWTSVSEIRGSTSLSLSSLGKRSATRGSTGRGLNAPHFTRFAQLGRSMVEMLGVLAVMGVLSVAGIAGFNTAMNKYRANEILNEASKRATVVAAQAIMGRTGTISLGEFGNNSVSGATFGASATIVNNQIKLTLSGVADPVCAQMKTALGENAIMAVDNKCTILAFNADMSRGVTVRGTSTADG